MKIFVATWFYPPTNTSEAICAYKLLRNSSFKYDVFSSLSKSWSYDSKFNKCKENNIRNFYIRTNSVEKWVKESIKQFIKLNKTEKYDCIMTRAMPEDSVLIGIAIKKKFPNVKWIASFADPIANNPYMFRAYIDNDPSISNENKKIIKNILRGTDISNIDELEKNSNAYFIKRLCYLRKIELEALKYADIIVGPNEDLLFYINETWSEKYYVVPHSFDKSFYPRVENAPKNKKIIFTFIGMTDNFRSLLPIVKAIVLIKKHNPNLLNKFEMQFIGNITEDVKKLINKENLLNNVIIKKPIDYQTSLKVMKASSFLIHIDANFNELGPKGSIFLAGKISDYLGSGKPIFGVTGKNSPAYKVINECGGVVCGYSVEDIYNGLLKILNGEFKYKENNKSLLSYDSTNVAKKYDQKILSLFDKKEVSLDKKITKDAVKNDLNMKIISICVPSYNVEKSVSYTIFSLLNHKMRNFIEILVIDDGSKDKTRDVALKFQNKFKNIVRVISKENGGHGSTINRAISESRGKYFMVVDGDDYVDSKEFCEFINFLKTHISDSVDLFVNPYNEYYLDTKEIKFINDNTKILKRGRIYNFSQLKGKELYFSMHSSTYRTEILKNMNKKILEHSYYVDCEYMLFPIKYVDKIMLCNFVIYTYCKGNVNQSVSIKSYSSNFEQHTNVCKDLINYYIENKMSPAHSFYYERVLIFILYSQYTLPIHKGFDQSRGKTINIQFDKYLKKTSPHLYKKVGEYRIVKDIRYSKFDYFSLTKKNFKNKGIKAIIRKLIINKFTIRLSKTIIFSRGPGAWFKTKLKLFLKRN